MPVCDLSELRTRALWRAVTAEFAAMFIFVFVAVGTALTHPPQGNVVPISLAFGLTIFVLAHAVGHISGAHVNPAVTLALAAARLVSPVRALLYAVAHVAGSVIAALVLKAGLDLDPIGGYNARGVVGSTGKQICVTAALFYEIILTFVLVLTVFATVDPGRETTGNGPLAIGMAVGVAHLIAVPITGCGINPGRSLGPALVNGTSAALDDLWIFIVGPLVGALLAAALYQKWLAVEAVEQNLQDKFASPRREKKPSSAVQRPPSPLRVVPAPRDNVGEMDIEQP